jgi:hypothetical protein
MAPAKSTSNKSAAKRTAAKPKKPSKLKSLIFGLGKGAGKKAKAGPAPKVAPKSVAKVVKEAANGKKAAGKAAPVKVPNAKELKQKAPLSPAAAAKAELALKKKVEAAHAIVSAAKAGKMAAGKGAAVGVPVKGKGRGKNALTGTAAIRAALEASGETVCREVACEGLATTGGYCRMHYIKNWKKIKRKELILKERKLNQYIEELVAKYPDKYIEAIRQDLANDKEFAKVISDLDLDESVDDYDIDGESMENLIDNIKRDFEDEGEGF